MLFSVGHWIFSFQYFFSALEIEAIMERENSRYKHKYLIFWTGNVFICISYLVLCCVSLDPNIPNLNTLFEYLVWIFSLNLVIDMVCTIMVTIAVIKINKISNMLPSHIHHNVAMIWSHLICFNVYNIVEVGLVCYSWYSVQVVNN